MKILGFDPSNPFSLFLILILLLAANGSFDPKAVSQSEAGDPLTKPNLWQDWARNPLFQKRQGPRLCLGRKSLGKRIRLRRELAASTPKVMPLGR